MQVETLIERYRILKRLGVGGMCEVYKAEDLRLKRIVAIKVLQSSSASDVSSGRHLESEAHSIATINHPHVASIYELEQNGHQPFIVMEYVEGRTLAQKIENERPDIGSAVEIGIQIAEALCAAHSRGVVHGDIKSSNVVVTPASEVKVLDFGLAKISSRLINEKNTDSKAAPGLMFAGTPGYASPEQARGEPLDDRTDIFSLGVVLFEMVTGRLPFAGGSPAAALRAVIETEAPPLAAYRSDMPLEFENIVRKALEKDRRERYQSAGEILSDLKDLKLRLQSFTAPERLSGQQTSAINLESVEPVERTPESRAGFFIYRRFRKWLSIAALMAAPVLVLSVLLLRPRGGEWLLPPALLMLTIGFYFLYRAANGRQTKPVYSLPKGAGFRGLLPFQEADRDRFYGRGFDTASLFDLIAHKEFRFGVLFGDSGCGKTSLVKAGLIPKLWDEGYLPLYCRSYKDPMACLLEETRKQTQIEMLEGEPEIEYLRRVGNELTAVIVIICDQFEEFFVNFKTKREREPFIRLVAECQNDERLLVKFLFSLRSDFLYLISSEFSDKIFEPLLSSKIYHLQNFDQEQAAEIIEKSARRANLPLEQGLSRQVAHDLAIGDTVSPSELQIVGERLQSKRIYTAQAYRRAGGKEPLVHSFLEDVIEASGDEEGAKLLLRSLISDENTRLTLPLEEIAKRMQRSRPAVERLLNLFAEARLIREIQDDEPWRYELMHEYLIEKINQITGTVMDATQRANRLFRQYLSSYAVDKRTLIPIARLLFIRRYSDLQRGGRERELLQKSLRWGVFKASAAGLLLVAVIVTAAAALSINVEWQGARLTDGHRAAVRQAAFSPDGRLLVSVGEDAKVIVWDFARRERTATLEGHTDWVTSIAFSPDGKWFATGSHDRTVIVWDAVRLDKAAVLGGHSERVIAVAFSPDGKLLASAPLSDHGTILWDANRWEKIRDLSTGLGYGTIFFSPDSRLLQNTNGQTVDVATGRITENNDNLGGNWAALSPDYKQIVRTDGRGNVRFFGLTKPGDFKEQKLLGFHERVHRFHGRAAAFSPDGKLVATCADDIILWEAATQTKITRLAHTAEVWGVTFSLDGRWLVSTHADGAILLWDVAEREAVANFNEHHGSVRSVAFSPDGKRVASASEDRSIIVWNAESGQKEAVLVGHETRITAIEFSPDGQWIVSCDQNGLVQLWDISNHQLRLTFKYSGKLGGDYHPVYDLAISPDGRYVAVTHGVYDTADGRQIMDKGYGLDNQYVLLEGVYGMDFSADGRLLACATEYGHIALWDTEKWQRVDLQQSTGSLFTTMRLSADGKLLVTGETDGSVKLWETSPLRVVAVVGRHGARVKSVAFSPDGSEIISSSEDQTIALWDVSRRNLITRIGTHTAPVLSVAFSPDGKRIASGEHDRSVRIYTRHRTLWGNRLD